MPLWRLAHHFPCADPESFFQMGVTCWERADHLALVCGVFCEFVTFPLVSWVRCGTWLYRFLIFATLLTLTTYFFCWWWERWFKYQYKRAIIGPAAKRHLNGVSLAGRWWPNIESLLGSWVILQGIRTSMAKKPLAIFVIFQGGGSGPPVAPLDPHMFPTMCPRPQSSI